MTTRTRSKWNNGRRLRRQWAGERAYTGDAQPAVFATCQERGLSLRELASSIGVETQVVRDIACGRVPRLSLPFYRALPRIAAALEMRPDALYPDEWLEWAERRLIDERASFLRRRRIRQGLSISDLAKLSQVRAEHIRRLELGERPWRAAHIWRAQLERIATALGTTTDMIADDLNADAPVPPLVRGRPETVVLPPGWPDIWRWRSERGMTRKGLAGAAQVSLGTLMRLEAGHGVGVRLAVLKRNLQAVADVLERPHRTLMTRALLTACRRERERRRRQAPQKGKTESPARGSKPNPV